MTMTPINPALISPIGETAFNAAIRASAIPLARNDYVTSDGRNPWGCVKTEKLNGTFSQPIRHPLVAFWFATVSHDIRAIYFNSGASNGRYVVQRHARTEKRWQVRCYDFSDGLSSPLQLGAKQPEPELVQLLEQVRLLFSHTFSSFY